MLGMMGRTGYKPVPKYEVYLAEQIEAVPEMRRHKCRYYHRELKQDHDIMMARAEAAGVDFDGEYDSYPDLEFEPDVAVFMDKIITYMHMATTIIEIEEYAEKLEAQQQIKGRGCSGVARYLQSALQRAFK